MENKICQGCGIYYSDHPENCPVCHTGSEAIITDHPHCVECNIKDLWWRCPCKEATVQKVDTFKASLVWGRIGASLMAIIAFGLSLYGYNFSPEDQAAVYEIVSTSLMGVSGLLALVSKVRETRRLAKE